jgi:DNA-binding CsgD family transcriptional regulator
MDELLPSVSSQDLDLSDILTNGSELSLQRAATEAYLQSQNTVLKVSLTATERRICFGLLNGLSAKQIARHRNCSYRTVENHIAKIKSKFGVKTLSPILLANIIYFDSELRVGIELSAMKKISVGFMDSIDGLDFDANDVRVFCRNCLVKWISQEVARSGVKLNLEDTIKRVFSENISI